MKKSIQPHQENGAIYIQLVQVEFLTLMFLHLFQSCFQRLPLTLQNKQQSVVQGLYQSKQIRSIQLQHHHFVHTMTLMKAIGNANTPQAFCI